MFLLAKKTNYAEFVQLCTACPIMSHNSTIPKLDLVLVWSTEFHMNKEAS